MPAPAKNQDLHGSAPDTSPAALLLIDVINDLEFEGGDRLLEPALAMAHALVKLKGRCRQLGIPTIYLNDNAGKWREDQRTIVERCLDIVAAACKEQGGQVIKTIGAMTKIQADAYITAYSTLEEHVFVAPCVVTTNDNFMGRTERRHELIKGPTIRRGARIGGGAVLCPAVEIGEEAFVGAGAVVIKDVPPRVLVVGNPARVLRDVPEGELLARDP